MGKALALFFESFYTGARFAGVRPRCPSCAEPLPVRIALPLAGPLLTGNRCPSCGAGFPWRWLLLPLGSALLFLASALVFDGLGPALLAGLFASVFLLLTLTDLDRRLIPNRVVYPSLLIALVFSWAWPDTSLAEILAGGLVAVAIAVALVVFSLPFGAEAFGMGDVKMIILIGLVVGLPAIIIGVFIGTLAAGVAAGLLLLLRKKSRKDYLPHGPFLALGALIALYWGQDLWDWYIER